MHITFKFGLHDFSWKFGPFELGIVVKDKSVDVCICCKHIHVQKNTKLLQCTCACIRVKGYTLLINRIISNIIQSMFKYLERSHHT